METIIVSDDIILEPEKDYALKEGHVWITVGNVSLWIKKDEGSVSVAAYPKEYEDTDPMDALLFYFDNVNDVMDDIEFDEEEAISQQERDNDELHRSHGHG